MGSWNLKPSFNASTIYEGYDTDLLTAEFFLMLYLKPENVYYMCFNVLRQTHTHTTVASPDPLQVTFPSNSCLYS